MNENNTIIVIGAVRPDGTAHPIGDITLRPGSGDVNEATVESDLSEDDIRAALTGMAVLSQGLRLMLDGSDPTGMDTLTFDGLCRPVATAAQTDALARLLARLQSRTADEVRALDVDYPDWDRRDEQDRQAMRDLATGMLDTVREAG
ncbi:hypothetical protein [Bifidobacterium porcinum]|uniref:hypothetical protein n=1 Tax=Bifidobacterium porcinum TaxID=212365 RepID=UPI003993991E